MLCTGLDCAVVTERNGCQVLISSDFSDKVDVPRLQRKLRAAAFQMSRPHNRKEALSINFSGCFVEEKKLDELPLSLSHTGHISVSQNIGPVP